MEELPKLWLWGNIKGASNGLLIDDTLRPFRNITTSEKKQSLKNLILVTSKLTYKQLDVKKTEAQKDLFCLSITTQVQQRWDMESRAIEEVSQYRDIGRKRVS